MAWKLSAVSWIRFPPEPSIGLPSRIGPVNAALSIFSSLSSTHRRNGHVTLTLARMLPLSSESQPPPTPHPHPLLRQLHCLIWKELVAAKLLACERTLLLSCECCGASRSELGASLDPCSCTSQGAFSSCRGYRRYQPFFFFFFLTMTLTLWRLHCLGNPRQPALIQAGGVSLEPT